MVLLQCDSWSFHTEDPADGRLPHAASPETLKPHHSTGLSYEQHVGGRAFLHDSLRLLTDAHRAYAHSDDGSRRLANQAFYTRLEVTENEQLRPRLVEPFATIVAEAAGGKEAKREHSTSSDVACSRKTLWVGAEGLEPPTPCL